MPLRLVRTSGRVRVAAAWVSARCLPVPTTGVGMSTADVTARMGASTSITVRSAAAGGARMATFVARYRMPTSGRTVVYSTGVTVTSRPRATVIFRSMPARASVMRYRTAAVRGGSMRSNNAPSRELTGSRRRGHRGPAVVKRRTQLSVTGSGMFVVTLHRCGFEMMLVFRGELVRGRVRLDAAGAVERHMVDVVDDGPVIHVGDVDAAHVHDRAVVEVSSTAPVTALESNTAIAEAVIHTAVEADMRTPVATVPRINATAPAPVSRRPQ